MTTMTIQAIYTSGVLKPVKKLTLPEGTTIEAEIKILPQANASAPISFADLAGIWGHLSVPQVEQLDQQLLEVRQLSNQRIKRLVEALDSPENEP